MIYQNLEKMHFKATSTLDNYKIIRSSKTFMKGKHLKKIWHAFSENSELLAVFMTVLYCSTYF